MLKVQKNTLILGMKVGPSDWETKLIKSKLSIPACEVYFDLSNLPSYRPLFQYLKNNKITVGLHFSSLLSGSLDPNFATDNKTIYNDSVRLLKKTVDIASNFKFSYVVYHPGSSRVWGIDKKKKVFLTDIVTDKQISHKIFLEAAIKMQNYTRTRQVKLYAETLPRKLLSFEFAELGSREQTFDAGFIPFSLLLQAGRKGVGICNDICHTLAGVDSTNPSFLQEELIKRSKLLLPYTGLVHLASMHPPFNGTDDNGAFLPEDYEKEAIPTKKILRKLLQIFAQKENIILIPEPKLDHKIAIANYQSLSGIIANL